VAFGVDGRMGREEPASGGPFTGPAIRHSQPTDHGACQAKEQARSESSQTGEYCMTGVLVRGVTG